MPRHVTAPLAYAATPGGAGEGDPDLHAQDGGGVQISDSSVVQRVIEVLDELEDAFSSCSQRTAALEAVVRGSASGEPISESRHSTASCAPASRSVNHALDAAFYDKVVTAIASDVR